jgi:hypothetical protein
MNSVSSKQPILQLLQTARISPALMSWDIEIGAWIAYYPRFAGDMRGLIASIENLENLYVLRAERQENRVMVWITDDPETVYSHDWHNLTLSQQAALKWIGLVGQVDGFCTEVIDLLEAGVVSYAEGAFSLNTWGKLVYLASNNSVIKQ